MGFVNRAKVALAIPRSLLLNIKLFGWEGVRIPVLFSNRVSVKGLRRGGRCGFPTRLGSA